MPFVNSHSRGAVTYIFDRSRRCFAVKTNLTLGIRRNLLTYQTIRRYAQLAERGNVFSSDSTGRMSTIVGISVDQARRKASTSRTSTFMSPVRFVSRGTNARRTRYTIATNYKKINGSGTTRGVKSKPYV